MSRFTNDVDTVQEALNNSFTMVIQSSLTLAGTVIMLLVLNVNMALIVIVFLLIMFGFIRWNGKRSKEYYDRQQEKPGGNQWIYGGNGGRAEGGEDLQP